MSDGASLLSDEVRTATPVVVTAGADQQAAPNGSDAEDKPVPQGAWYANFVQGLDKSEAMSFRNTASRYTTPQDFAKSVVEMRKTAIFAPKPDAKPEAWEAIFDKLGRPKEAKAYVLDFGDVELDDSEKELAETGFKPVAHRLGLLPDQVKGLTQWQGKIKQTQTDAAIARANKTGDERAKALRDAWGQQYDANKSYVANVVKGNTDKQGFEQIASARLDDGTYVVDHPAFANLFAKLGSQMAEDDRDPTVFNASARESAQSEIDKIESEAITKGLHPGDPRWPHQQLKALYARAHGTRPLPIGGLRMG
jgi:hypothetical protein